MGLIGYSKLYTKKSLASAIAEILKGNHKFRGAPVIGGVQIGSPTAHHKNKPIGKSGRCTGLGSSEKNVEFSLLFLQQLQPKFSNLVRNLGLQRPLIKSHPEEKVPVKVHCELRRIKQQM